MALGNPEINAARFFRSDTFFSRMVRAPSLCMERSSLRVSSVLTPKNAIRASVFSTISRLMPLSIFPLAELAPPSSPPCPASKISTRSTSTGAVTADTTRSRPIQAAPPKMQRHKNNNSRSRFTGPSPLPSSI